MELQSRKLHGSRKNLKNGNKTTAEGSGKKALPKRNSEGFNMQTGGWVKDRTPHAHMSMDVGVAGKAKGTSLTSPSSVIFIESQDEPLRKR